MYGIFTYGMYGTLLDPRKLTPRHWVAKISMLMCSENVCFSISNECTDGGKTPAVRR